MGLMREWLERSDDYARFNSELAGLVQAFLEDLVAVLRELAEARVEYDEVEALTGVPLKTLQNRKLPNVGTPLRGQFRLGDLPFRDGAASPARLLAAFDQLIDQRAHRQEEDRDERQAAAIREIRRKRSVREYQQRRSERGAEAADGGRGRS